MQDTGQWRNNRQADKISAKTHAILECEDDQRAENAHADECDHPQHTKNKRQREPTFPGHDVAHQDLYDLLPVQPFGFHDAFGRLV